MGTRRRIVWKRKSLGPGPIADSRSTPGLGSQVRVRRSYEEIGIAAGPEIGGLIVLKRDRRTFQEQHGDVRRGQQVERFSGGGGPHQFVSDLTSTRHVQCFLVLVGQTLYDSFPDAAAEHCRDAMAQGRFQQLGCGLSGGVWNLYRPAGECPC